MRIIVLAVGRLRPPFADDVQHYQKLLAGLAGVEMVDRREAAPVPKRIPERAFVSLLDVRGEAYSSEDFARFVEQRRQGGRDLCFVIGGPKGLDLDVVDHRFSLGTLTLPYQLARVVLLEQVYRAHKIIKGEPYHY